MKYQRLVSNTTPSSLQDWLDDELERRGIDGVYTRYILSLLQQDSVDVEPSECQHANFKSHQLKVCHKYGGPESLDCGMKSKHQKWKTWGKQILLTSSSTCCNMALSSDLEKLRKNAAIECLKSVTDEKYDIENLVDEVCIKLKNIKNIEIENDENSGRNPKAIKRKGAFNILPSSPTDEAEKYFAAFPPLNGKLDQNTELSYRKILINTSENVWCRKCLKKKIKTDESENLEDSFFKQKAICNSPFLKESSNVFQALIPYGSLKVIGSVRKNYKIANSEVYRNQKNVISVSNVQKASPSLSHRLNCFNFIPSEPPIKNEINFTGAVSLTSNPIELNPVGTIAFEKTSVNTLDKKLSMMVVCPSLPFTNLKRIEIDDSAFNIVNKDIKFDLIKHAFSFEKIEVVLGTAFANVSKNLNDDNSEYLTSQLSKKFTNLASIWHNSNGNQFLEKLDISAKGNNANNNSPSVWSYEKKNSKLCPIIEETSTLGASNVPYHSDTWHSEAEKPSNDIKSKFEVQFLYGEGTPSINNVKSSQNPFTFFLKNTIHKVMNRPMFDEKENTQLTVKQPYIAIEKCVGFSRRKVCSPPGLEGSNTAKCLSTSIGSCKDPWHSGYHCNDAIIPWPGSPDINIEEPDVALELPSLLRASHVHCKFSDLSDSHKFSFTHYKGESKFIEVVPSRTWSSSVLEINFDDDEIFNSDDGSSEFYFSDEEEENLLTSSKTHFQPIEHDSFQSSQTDIKISTADDETCVCKLEIAHSAHYERARDYCPKPLGTQNKHTGQQLLAKILHIDKVIASIDTKVRGRAISSSFDELSSLFQVNQDQWDLNSFDEETLLSFPIDVTENFEDKGTNTEDFNMVQSIDLEEQSDISSSFECSTVSEREKYKNICAVEDNWFENSYKGTSGKKLSNWKGNFSLDESIWGHDSSDFLLNGKSLKMERALSCDNSEDIKALRKEIKEEEDELLRGLCCLNDASDNVFSPTGFESKLSMGVQDAIDAECINVFAANTKRFTLKDTSESEISLPEELASNDFSNKCGEYNEDQIQISNPDEFSMEDVFLPKSINSDYIHSSSNEAYQGATNFFSLAGAEGPYENFSDHMQEYVQEDCLDWSNATENFTDIDYRSYYDRSYSLGDLDQEESEQTSFDFMSSERSLYNTSDLDEDWRKRNIFGRLIPRRRMKHKYPPCRRPCTFFLEGNCRRSDCRFAHDLSTITCRFWQEGSCFKGVTCPFLHGYIKDCTHRLRSRSPDCNYALESEADFPSLSAVTTESSGAKSHPVDIIQDKGSRPKRRKGKSQSNCNPLKNDESETSSSWPGYKSM